MHGVGGNNVSDMTCQELVELVTGYLDGVLDEETERRFDEHLARCDGCIAYFDQIRQTIRGLGNQSAEALPNEIRDALLHIFRNWPKPDNGGEPSWKSTS
jgi:anti-sigma factor RsiW